MGKERWVFAEMDFFSSKAEDEYDRTRGRGVEEEILPEDKSIESIWFCSDVFDLNRMFVQNRKSKEKKTETDPPCADCLQLGF